MTTFQAVWPITDPGMPAAELISQAARDLPNIASRHRVRITGEPRFQVRIGRHVQGSQGAKRVITCNVEAEDMGPRNYGGAVAER